MIVEIEKTDTFGDDQPREVMDSFVLGWQWGQHHHREATDREAIELVGYDDANRFCQGSIDGSEGDRWRLDKKGEKEE